MCGIVGVFTKLKNGLSHSSMKVFENLMVIDTLRGADSAGVFAAHKNGEDVYVHKQLGTGFEFIKSDGWDMIGSYLFTQGKFVVGHNRSATVGGVSVESAHPFHHGHITLVHNGTLKSFDNLKKDNKSITVDSEAICYALSQKKWEDVLPEINGAFQLVWYDSKKKELFIAGNGDRPFWYAYSKNGDSMYFASEYEMLQLACQRNRESLCVSKDGFSFFSHKKNTLISIPINYDEEFIDLVPQTFEGYKPFFPPVVASATVGTTKTKSKKTTTKETKKQQQQLFGKKIFWEVYEKNPVKNSTDIRVTGYCFSENYEEVSCILSAEEAEKWDTDDAVCSTVKRIINRQEHGVLYISNNDITSLVLNDILPEEKQISYNGETIYKQDWDDLTTQYKECGSCTDLVTWEEIPSADVSFMGGRVPRYCMCARCTADFYSTSEKYPSWKN